MMGADLIDEKLRQNPDKYKEITPKTRFNAGDPCPMCDGSGALDSPVYVRNFRKKSNKERIWEYFLELCVIITIFYMLDWIRGRF